MIITISRSKRRTGLLAIALLMVAALLALPSASPQALAADEVLFDDMEHGDPFGNGWFAFNGSVGGGGIDANNVDLPPALGGAFSLQSGWGSGGTPGFYGGFGRTNPSDLSGTEYFNFWINPDAGQDYTLEINLQEDDNSDGAINPPDDDEFQYNCVVSAAGPCATSGGGWQLVSIPLADFFDDNSFLFGGNGVLDPIPPALGGNGELINVVVAVIGNDGTDVNFRTDYWAFSLVPIVPDASTVIDDFENGLPFGSAVPDGEPIGFYTFQGDGSVAIADRDDAAGADAPRRRHPEQRDADGCRRVLVRWLHPRLRERCRRHLGHPGLVDQRRYFVLDVRLEQRHADVHRHPRQP